MRDIVEILLDAEEQLRKVDDRLKGLPDDLSERIGKLRSNLRARQIIILQTLTKLFAGMGRPNGPGITPKVVRGQFLVREATWVHIGVDGTSLFEKESEKNALQEVTFEICIQRGYYRRLSRELLESVEKSMEFIEESLRTSRDQSERLEKIGQLATELST